MLPRKRSIHLLVLAVLSIVRTTLQHGSGAPAGSCIDQMPRHPGVEVQYSVSPYVIWTSTSQIRQGDVMNVTIDAPNGLYSTIGGFILQARDTQNPDTIVGKFTSVPLLESTKIISCRGENDTVTHSTPNPKPALTFQWQAPTDFLGSVSFKATVAQSYATFWKGIVSSLIEVVTPDTVTSPPVPRTTPRNEPVSPPVILESKPKADTQKLDVIYEGCGDTKLCYGVPQQCVEQGTCKAIVAVLVEGGSYTFEVQGSDSPKYVAAGLSLDNQMGDDSVMECINTDKGVKLNSSWTYPKEEPYVTRKLNQLNILHLQESSFIDGKLYCKFSREVVTEPMKGNVIDLMSTKYNLMIVAGDSLKDENRVGFHNKVFESTGEPMSLSEVGIVGSASKLLIQLHGSFMVLAWMFTSTVGIFFARYYRQTWVGKKIAGLDIWFVFHRSMMQLTWLLTIVAFILIVISVKGWVSPANNPHAITGIITVILCFLQPFGAFFRPHPGTKRRPIFNWLHFSAGNFAYLFALITLFLSINLAKAQLPLWTTYLISAFIVYHVAIHIIITFTVCMKDTSFDLNRVNAFPMKETRNSRQISQVIDSDLDAPHSSCRKFILALYVVGAAVFTAAMICTILIFHATV